jgi:translation initiation factor IF-1
MSKEDYIEMQGELSKTSLMRPSRSNWKMDILFMGLFPENAHALHPILPGDKVTVQLTPYDLTKARIVFRAK